MRLAAHPSHRPRRCPHLLAQERPEILGGLGCVEEENDHDVVRIVIGLKDVCRLDASLLPRGRVPGVRAQPRFEVGDVVSEESPVSLRVTPRGRENGSGCLPTPIFAWVREPAEESGAGVRPGRVTHCCFEHAGQNFAYP